jgi:hypothetical protein
VGVSLHDPIRIGDHGLVVLNGQQLPWRVAGGQPAWNPHRAKHHGHGARIVVAIALFDIEQEVIDGIHLLGWRRNVRAVRIASQIGLDGGGLVVGVFVRCCDLPGEFRDALRDALGKMQVAFGHPRGIICPVTLEQVDWSLGDGRDCSVGGARAQLYPAAHSRHVDQSSILGDPVNVGVHRKRDSNWLRWSEDDVLTRL